MNNLALKLARESVQTVLNPPANKWQYTAY